MFLFFLFFGQIGMKVLKISAILLKYPTFEAGFIIISCAKKNTNSYCLYFVMSAQKMINTFGFKLYFLHQNRDVIN